jgi:hypothetical protein
MALSPEYGWPEPDNSSLVKNGAQDIRALGDAIDTSVWNVGYGQAGKNKIINGDFGIWQRGTSFTNLATNTYTTDRFFVSSVNSTIDVNRSTFTPGTAPVAGYEGQFFATIASEATDTDARFRQNIEDVRTFAGQTVTVSFWAKSNITTDALRWIRVQQTFGSGGSASVSTDSVSITLTSSWQRYSVLFSVPSVSGKTIGASSSLGVVFGLKASTAQTLDLWGVQVEAGSIATPFQTATGTLQGELAACQRYYWRATGGSANAPYAQGIAAAVNVLQGIFQYPVTMRVAPTSVDFSTLGLSDSVNAVVAITALSMSNNTPFATLLSATTAGGLTQFRYYQILNNGIAGFLGFNAEL